MTQKTLDFEVSPKDSHVHPNDASRLTGQNAAILARLRQGPATNIELYGICLRPGARVWDLKRAGVPIKSRRERGGVWVYWIE